MQIEKVEENKKDYMPLLLLADEQENMIERYLDRGEMFILLENATPITVCIVTDEGNGVFEIKNLATHPEYQRKGYGKAMVEFIEQQINGKGTILQVGTGETPSTIGFYQHCGFSYSHRIPDFFTNNYDHAIIEDGIMLRDMAYFHKTLGQHKN